MSKTLTWLLAGAAFTLIAGAGMAYAQQDPEAAARQAAADARVAAEHAREAAEKARETAREAREQARREVRVHRGDRDGHAWVFRGGDRAEHLRTLLQLRPNQEAALTAYLEAVGKGGHRDHMVRFDRGGEGRTTAERLAEMEARMAEQQAAMKRRIAATRGFYAQLDDKQKKVFDAMSMLMFAGPGFGPMLMPIHMMEPPVPPVPPVPPAPPPQKAPRA